jgi:hypothetical protein
LLSKSKPKPRPLIQTLAIKRRRRSPVLAQGALGYECQIYLELRKEFANTRLQLRRSQTPSVLEIIVRSMTQGVALGWELTNAFGVDEKPSTWQADNRSGVQENSTNF